MKVLKFLATAYLFGSPLGSSLAYAQIAHPVRDIHQLMEPEQTKVVMVQKDKVRVIMADYDLIRKDFPNTTKDMSNEQIDRWLIEKTGFISVNQAKYSRQRQDISEVIPLEKSTDGNMVNADAFRPENYGRALVFSTPEGLIDVKGVGAAEPSNRHHRTGLADLGEVIREFIYEKLVGKIFKHSEAGFHTVGSYAVLDYGFNIKADGANDRAGTILRQAHQRVSPELTGNNFLDIVTSTTMEKLLRSYGITSSGETSVRHMGGDMINIQGTPQGDIVDFGAFLARESFSRKAFNYYYAHTGAYVGNQALMPSLSTKDPWFWATPDKDISVPFDKWGYEEFKDDPKKDRPWQYAHELASALANGQAQVEHAQLHWKTMVDSFHPAESKKGLFKDVNTKENRKKMFVQILENEIQHKFVTVLTLNMLLDQYPELATKEMLDRIVNGSQNSNPWELFFCQYNLRNHESQILNALLKSERLFELFSTSNQQEEIATRIFKKIILATDHDFSLSAALPSSRDWVIETFSMMLKQKPGFIFKLAASKQADKMGYLWMTLLRHSSLSPELLVSAASRSELLKEKIIRWAPQVLQNKCEGFF